MLFSSLSFLCVFLPVFLLCYYIAPVRVRRWILLLGSLIFYAVGEPIYVMLLIGSVIANYGFGLILCAKDGALKRFAFFLVLLLNLSVLFLFKYWNFFAGIWNGIPCVSVMPGLQWAMPLGISFYTFQILSYQIDCYTGKKKRPAGFLDFALFVCMFPQLIVGPIIRYQAIEKELKLCNGNLQSLETGAKTFTVGLGLKVLLANQLATLYNSIGVIGTESLSVALAWLGALAYSMQIYFDFWGYSMMAVGLGEMLGFTIPENFKQPYFSKSISEFWRRWHITLGEWFKDYVYIPLGGNRKGFVRTCLNLFIVWALTGLWHGADWNFVIWGLFFFLMIVVEKTGLGKWLEKTKVLGHLYVFGVIPITWMIFAKTDISDLVRYIGCMFGVGAVNGATQLRQLIRFLTQYWVLLLAGVLFVTPLPMRLFKKYRKTPYVVPFLLFIFWFSIRQIYIGKENPFLYFRF